MTQIFARTGVPAIPSEVVPLLAAGLHDLAKVCIAIDLELPLDEVARLTEDEWERLSFLSALVRPLT